jgi:DNA segregation ATPase FtsK/SpoIIIE-like protein
MRSAGRCASASPRSRSATATRCPSVDLLNPPPPPANVVLDKAALERNARLLESVLDDFSVKGEIVEVRPGPVVTMYELGAGSGNQGEPGHPIGRRHRPQHVGAVGPSRRPSPAAR